MGDFSGTVILLRKGDEKKGKLGTYAMKRVAAGAHLPTPRLLEPAKRPDDRADYCLVIVEENNHCAIVQKCTIRWFHSIA